MCVHMCVCVRVCACVRDVQSWMRLKATQHAQYVSIAHVPEYDNHAVINARLRVRNVTGVTIYLFPSCGESFIPPFFFFNTSSGPVLFLPWSFLVLSP